MKLFAAAFLSLSVAIHAANDPKKPGISFTDIPSPAGARAVGAALVTAPDGTHWLSWVEAGGPMPTAPAPTAPAATHHHGAEPAPADAPPNTLRFSTFDGSAQKWSPARTIFRGASVPLSSADFPQLAIDGRGTVTAVWTDGHGGAVFSTSTDRGATWSAPVAWTTASAEVEKFSFATLADGRVLAAWLDGRGKKSGAKAEQLYARVIGQTAPDVLVDPSVCDCCQTTLTAFLDGGALLAYRGRTEEEVRDIRTARFDGREWAEPRPLNHDDWRIAACPINGPRLASDGGRVAAAWFTAPDNDPRVLASFSPDAGTRFLMPLRVDRGKPVGHVDTVILHDGALLVTWLETDGSLWLRRITPDFSATDPIALAPAGSLSIKTNPRVALIRDYAGGKEPAQMLTVFAAESGLRTLLVNVPEGDFVEAEKNCDCAPTAEQLQGYPIRGTIVETLPASGTARVRHSELPGVFAEGTHDFTVGRELLPTVPPGREFLGRIERRAGAWRLFDVRLIATPPSN